MWRERYQAYTLLYDLKSEYASWLIQLSDPFIFDDIFIIQKKGVLGFWGFGVLGFRV
jgi:hypothetical protein